MRHPRRLRGAAAQPAARRAVEAIERQVRERTEAGLALDGLPDLSGEGKRDGFYQAQLIRELALRHITSWNGVELEGGPAAPTPELSKIASGFDRRRRARSGRKRRSRVGYRGEPASARLLLCGWVRKGYDIHL
jgi:hypothetical protein